MVVVDLGYCPRCGGQLEPCVDSGKHRSCCAVCGFVVYHNPYPVVVTTVVDGDSALFVKRARAPEEGCWSMPGGYLEVDEPLEAGAARELAEETNIEASPTDLQFVGTSYKPLGGERAIVEIIFAVPREKTNGEPVARDDAAEVRFWTREEIEANPPQLRAGNTQPILWAIDTMGTGKGDYEPPLW